MKLWHLLVAIVGAAPLHAQTLPEPIPDAATMETMCSPRGAMQYAFGQRGVPGSSKIAALMDRKLQLPGELAPFSHAKPRSTDWSEQFMEMTYSVPIDTANAARATGLIDRLAAALNAAGWVQLKVPEGEEPLYRAGYSGDHVFSFNLPEAGDRKRVLLALSYDLGELTLSCGRDDLLYMHAQEAFGKLPPGTLRPAVPDIAIPVITTRQDCDSPLLQREAAALFAGGGADRFIGTMLARTEYRDRLTTWMIWRLDSSGKISPQRLLNLGMSALSKSSPKGDPFAALALLDELFPIIDLMAKAEKLNDPVQMCQSLIPFHNLMRKADAITLKQTQATQAALSAEAARLGVSLD